MLRRDDTTIAINELYVQLDGTMFVDDNPSVEKMVQTMMMKKSYVGTMIRNLKMQRTLNTNSHV
jgi:hypothetical protein